MISYTERLQGTTPAQPTIAERSQPEWIGDTGYPPSGRLDLDAPIVATVPEDAAHIFGYGSVRELAATLPEGARVADAGAGASTFGHAVARLREDISWTNIDASYAWEPIRERLAADAPQNLTFLAADLVQLPKPIEEEAFDQVFSYQALPHIILENRDSGLIATKNVLQLARAGGRLAIGPVYRYTKLERPLRARNDVVIADAPKTPTELNELSEHVFEAVKPTRWGAIRQRHVNRTQTRKPLKATRHPKSRGDAPQVAA